MWWSRRCFRLHCVIQQVRRTCVNKTASYNSSAARYGRHACQVADESTGSFSETRQRLWRYVVLTVYTIIWAWQSRQSAAVWHRQFVTLIGGRLLLVTCWLCRRRFADDVLSILIQLARSSRRELRCQLSETAHKRRTTRDKIPYRQGQDRPCWAVTVPTRKHSTNCDDFNKKRKWNFARHNTTRQQRFQHQLRPTKWNTK